MKLINRHLREQHEEMKRRVDESAPKPVTVKQHPEGEEPLTLANGTVVMAGDYYDEANGVAISATEIGDGGVWEEV